MQQKHRIKLSEKTTFPEKRETILLLFRLRYKGCCLESGMHKEFISNHVSCQIKLQSNCLKSSVFSIFKS